MDTLNHFLLAFVLFGDWKLALISVSPDFFLSVIKYRDYKNGQSLTSIINETNPKTLDIHNSKLFYAHKILHNVFVPIIISFVDLLAGVAYGLHIIVDIFTHEKDYYFLPFKKKLGGIIEWTSLKFAIKFKIALCFILLALIAMLLGTCSG